jgi:predicted dehydrogenase
MRLGMNSKSSFSVLFVGLGSIGTRHLNNLTALCEKRGVALRADALRSNLSRPLRPGVAEKLAHQFTSLDAPDALAHYGAAFITNPTSLHAEALSMLEGRAEALFIEKPILDAAQADLPLSSLLESGQKAYVAAPMRWCGTMLALKEYLQANPEIRPYSIRAICSSYLPDWRPGVDYRTVYSAHRTMGGGVTIDLIHEWDYLVDLFGRPEQVYNFKGTYSDLEVDSDDLSVYIARWKNLLGEVHLDYFGRTYRRTLELFCKDGTITADFGAGTLTLENGETRHFEEDVNERYVREMAYFFDYAQSDAVESVNSPQQAQDVLKLTLGQA